jgi:hypothetical protein
MSPIAIKLRYTTYEADNLRSYIYNLEDEIKYKYSENKDILELPWAGYTHLGRKKIEDRESWKNNWDVLSKFLLVVFIPIIISIVYVVVVLVAGQDIFSSTKTLVYYNINPILYWVFLIFYLSVSIVLVPYYFDVRNPDINPPNIRAYPIWKIKRKFKMKVSEEKDERLDIEVKLVPVSKNNFNKSKKEKYFKLKATNNSDKLKIISIRGLFFDKDGNFLGKDNRIRGKNNFKYIAKAHHTWDATLYYTNANYVKDIAKIVFSRYIDDAEVIQNKKKILKEAIKL